MESLRSNLYIFFFHSRASYILQVIPFTLLIGILFWITRGLWLKKHNVQRSNAIREMTLLLFACYSGGLCALVLTPSNFWNFMWFRLINGYSGGELYPLFSGGFNFTPSFFRYIAGMLTGGSWSQFMLIGNILLFIPFGYFLPAIWENVNSVKTIALGITLSLFVELWQPIVGRSFDIDDIISNTIGTIIGYLLFIILKRLFGRLHKSKYVQQEHSS